MGCIADDDDRASAPDRHVAEVIGVVACQLQLAGSNEIDGWPRVIREEGDQLFPPCRV
jgi:hypothetical protein